MNAATAILLSVLVHLGGVGLDTTREASLQWYQNAQLQGQWELEVTRSGVYRFVSDEGLIIVERLREADMIYALQHYETVGGQEGNATGPVPRVLRSLGTVSLQPQAQNLRAPRASRGTTTVVIDQVPVAWSAVPSGSGGNGDSQEMAESEDSGEGPEEASVEAPVTVGGAGFRDESRTASTALAGELAVSITPGQWSATHTDSRQVMVLQVR